jgi:hypothetical protein
LVEVVGDGRERRLGNFTTNLSLCFLSLSAIDTFPSALPPPPTPSPANSNPNNTPFPTQRSGPVRRAAVPSSPEAGDENAAPVKNAKFNARDWMNG